MKKKQEDNPASKPDQGQEGASPGGVPAYLGGNGLLVLPKGLRSRRAGFVGLPVAATGGVAEAAELPAAAAGAARGAAGDALPETVAVAVAGVDLRFGLTMERGLNIRVAEVTGEATVAA